MPAHPSPSKRLAASKTRSTPYGATCRRRRKPWSTSKVAYTDRDGDLVTSIVGGKDCVFTCYEGDCCLCALERAHRAGKTSFIKPISCALYPIREKRFANGTVALNYNRWDVCKDAVKKGRELQLPVYKFLEGPLTRRFGKEWYAALCEVAEHFDELCE